MPTVTVLMSCYNASRYLSAAIESILAQTYRDYEFVVVNDGSTDRTLDIVKTYAYKDQRIQVLDKANTGLADSLNAGMRIAKGQWIARLDADDIALPARLTQQMAYIDSQPRIVLLGSSFIEINASGDSVRTYRYPVDHGRFARRIQRIGSFPPHSSWFYHKATIESLGGFNPRFERSQDADLWLRVSGVGNTGAVQVPLVKIRKHEASLSKDAGGRMQALFGMAALVCHVLRTRDVADPSVQNDDVWGEFMEWLALNVERNGLLEEKREWARLKHFYFSSSSRVIGFCRLLRVFASSRHVYRILHKKCFGSSLPARLAEDWMQRRCAVLSE